MTGDTAYFTLIYTQDPSPSIDQESAAGLFTTRAAAVDFAAENTANLLLGDTAVNTGGQLAVSVTPFTPNIPLDTDNSEFYVNYHIDYDLWKVDYVQIFPTERQARLNLWEEYGNEDEEELFLTAPLIELFKLLNGMGGGTFMEKITFVG